MATKLAYSADEFSKLSGLSVSNVYALMAKGEIPTVRLGRRFTIPASWVRKTYEAAEFNIEATE